MVREELNTPSEKCILCSTHPPFDVENEVIIVKFCCYRLGGSPLDR